MAGVITFGTAFVPDDRLEDLFHFLEQSKAVLGGVAGMRSIGLWKDCDFPNKFGILVEYESEDAAIAGWAELGSQEFMLDAMASAESPPNIRRFTAKHRHSFDAGAAPIGASLSLSYRNADPGMMWELENELHEIFSGLTVIEGFIGYAMGPNLAVEEEVLAMALWSTRAAFEESLPKKPQYEIRLYERVG